MMRFLVRLEPSRMPREVLLPSVRALARATGSEARNPKWTSYGALEIDVFSPSKADLDLFLAVMGPIVKPEFTRDLNQAPPFNTEDKLFEEARDLFNAERYWECHEVLEGIWRQKHGEEKRLLQGIILVCAALVHHQKGEESIAVGVLKRASKQLEYPEQKYGGFDIPALELRVEDMLRTGKVVNFPV